MQLLQSSPRCLVANRGATGGLMDGWLDMDANHSAIHDVHRLGAIHDFAQLIFPAGQRLSVQHESFRLRLGQ